MSRIWSWYKIPGSRHEAAMQWFRNWSRQLKVNSSYHCKIPRIQEYDSSPADMRLAPDDAGHNDSIILICWPGSGEEDWLWTVDILLTPPHHCPSPGVNLHQGPLYRTQQLGGRWGRLVIFFFIFKLTLWSAMSSLLRHCDTSTTRTSGEILNYSIKRSKIAWFCWDTSAES